MKTFKQFYTIIRGELFTTTRLSYGYIESLYCSYLRGDVALIKTRATTFKGRARALNRAIFEFIDDYLPEPELKRKMLSMDYLMFFPNYILVKF